MKFELVIDSRTTEVVIALLKEGKLVELHKEKHDNNYSVGDIYLGKVKKIVPGLKCIICKCWIRERRISSLLRFRISSKFFQEIY